MIDKKKTDQIDTDLRAWMEAEAERQAKEQEARYDFDLESG